MSCHTVRNTPTALEIEAYCASLASDNPLTAVLTKVRQVHGSGDAHTWELLKRDIEWLHQTLFPEAA